MTGWSSIIILFHGFFHTLKRRSREHDSGLGDKGRPCSGSGPCGGLGYPVLDRRTALEMHVDPKNLVQVCVWRRRFDVLPRKKHSSHQIPFPLPPTLLRTVHTSFSLAGIIILALLLLPVTLFSQP